LRGDRTAPGGLAALAEGEWDAVGRHLVAAPRAVHEAARLLAGRVGRYVYVSSRSVYAWAAPAGSTEDAPVVEGAEPDAGETGLRARQSAAANWPRSARFGPERALLVRAGLILGPYENVAGCRGWLDRIARGGPVLAPGPRDLAIQYVDVRDLAEWMLGAVERGLSGPYNLIGPQGHATMGSLLGACLRVTGGAAALRWTEPEVVLAAGIEPWTQLPVWVPPGSEEHDALHRGDVSRALADGAEVPFRRGDGGRYVEFGCRVLAGLLRNALTGRRWGSIRWWKRRYWAFRRG